MKFLRSFLWALLIVFVSILMFKLTLPYLAFEPHIAFLRTKMAIYHIDIWRSAFYIHIFSSIWVLLCGAVQFNEYVQNRYQLFHKLVGYIYVGFIVFLSGPSGLVMAYFANGGLFAQISFMLLSCLWIIFTVYAVLKILKGDKKAHHDFMMRSYALTFSAITLRTYAMLMPHFVHLNPKVEYVILAWLSWVPNLLFAEVLIWRKSRF